MARKTSPASKICPPTPETCPLLDVAVKSIHALRDEQRSRHDLIVTRLSSQEELYRRQVEIQTKHNAIVFDDLMLLRGARKLVTGLLAVGLWLWKVISGRPA